MKTIFVADKSTYGSEFYAECDSLDELKRAIVDHELQFKVRDESYTSDKYTEELFKQHSRGYTLYEVQLHDDECIVWDEYDGQSWFKIEKKDPKILSIVTKVEYDVLSQFGKMDTEKALELIEIIDRKLAALARLTGENISYVESKETEIIKLRDHLQSFIEAQVNQVENNLSNNQ